MSCAGNGTGSEPLPGWHWVEWWCEFAGTAVLMSGGLSAVFLDFGPHSPVTRVLPSASGRLLLTGVLFAGTGSLVAISPIGRRSGAHINPAVTLAFWLRGKVHPHDLAGYIVAQCLGALAATAALALAWSDTARALSLGATRPGRGLADWQAALLEAGMTAALVALLLVLTSRARTARYTPLGNWVLVAFLVWKGAPYTGASLNPARSLGPAVLVPLLGPLWVYLVGPVAGSLFASGLVRLAGAAEPVTAKLFHDPAYPSTLGGSLPVADRPLARGRGGRPRIPRS
jgi:aquaporin Z